MEQTKKEKDVSFCMYKMKNYGNTENKYIRN